MSLCRCHLSGKEREASPSCAASLRRSSKKSCSHTCLSNRNQVHICLRSVQMVSLFGGVVGFCICLSHWESNFGRSTGRFAFSLDLFGCVVFFCWNCWFGHLSVHASLYGFCSMIQQKRCSELPGKKHDPAIMLEPLARNVSHVLPHTAPGSRTRLPSRIQLHSDFRSVQMASLFGCVVGLCVCLITWKSNFGCWSRWWRARRIDLEVR